MKSHGRIFTQPSRVLHPLTIAGVLLCGLLLALAWMQAPTAQADGTVHRVPDDFGTIQGAIDAAAAGDEIRVVSGDYAETLVITKSLRLTGGWNISFTEQTRELSTVDAGQSGRVLTVDATSITPTVVISNFRFTNGDATGLGGVVTPTVPSAQVADVAAVQMATTSEAQQLQVTDLRTQLMDLAARGDFPGGQNAVNEMLARIDSLEAATQSELAVAPLVIPATPPVPSQEIDCGGGIYVRGAQLHLMTMIVSDNTASRTGAGAGGAICAVDAPADGLVLQSVAASRNVASQVADGYGGGIFFAGTDSPAAFHAEDIALRANRASLAGNGYGGGTFVTDAPAATFKLAVFVDNAGTLTGQIGYGGGMYLLDSPDVVMELVDFETNTAALTQFLSDPADWVIASGGGLYANNTPRLRITNDGDSPDILSLFVGNIAAFDGLGHGGGAYVANGANIQIDHTQFINNWAMVYSGAQGDVAGGGGVHLSSAPGANVVGNLFRSNVVAVLNRHQLDLFGGALDLNMSNHATVANNRFESNAGGTTAIGGNTHGGALAIAYTDGFTVTGNSYIDNVADLGLAGGLGGALYVKLANDVLIHANTFERNRGGAGAGIGGALTIEGLAGEESGFPAPLGLNDKLNNRVTVSGNVFRNNRSDTSLEGDQAHLGGAIAVNSTNGLTIMNNVLAGNAAIAGGALGLFGWDPDKVAHDAILDAQIVNNTLVGNAGDSGVYLEMWWTPITLTNNIIVSHTVGINVETGKVLGGMKAQVDYTVYNDNETNSQANGESTIIESNAISAPVAFANFWGGDYHLLPTSSAINAGDPAGVPPAPPVDIEGALRPFGPVVDIGAYEWHGPQVFLPLISQECLIPAVTGWIIGELADNSGSVIMRTTDGGLTWTRQYTTSATLDGLAVVDAQHVWVSGKNRTVLTTDDGGLNWQTHTLPDIVPITPTIKVTAVDAQTAWIITTVASPPDNRSYIMHTSDGGAAWSVQAQVASGSGTFSWIDAADRQHVWAVGGYSAALRTAPQVDPGFIWHTADGVTWMEQSEPAQGIVIGVDAVSANVVWAAGRQGVYRTLDGGTKWDYLPLFVTDANHVDSVDGGAQVWVAGDSFEVRYTDKGLSPNLTVDDWSDLTPRELGGKVAYMVDFIDDSHGWIAGGAFSADVGGVLARTCDGGASWKSQVWEEFDPIRIVGMIPITQ